MILDRKTENKKGGKKLFLEGGCLTRDIHSPILLASRGPGE
jgi:hypothetical protein